MTNKLFKQADENIVAPKAMPDMTTFLGRPSFVILSVANLESKRQLRKHVLQLQRILRPEVLSFERGIVRTARTNIGAYQTPALKKIDFFSGGIENDLLIGTVLYYIDSKKVPYLPTVVPVAAAVIVESSSILF